VGGDASAIAFGYAAAWMIVALIIRCLPREGRQIRLDQKQW
jgi:hypothetical protein